MRDGVSDQVRDEVKDMQERWLKILRPVRSWLLPATMTFAVAVAGEAVRPEREPEAAMAAARGHLREVPGADEVVFIKRFT